MRVFKDSEGRPWELAVNVSAVKRVRAHLDGLDLFGLVGDDMKGLAELMADPVRLVDVVYVLCADQARGRDLTDEDFGRAMSGDAIAAAADAFLEALVDFFPNPGVRAGLRKVTEKGRAVQARMLELATTRIDAIDPDSEAERLIGSSGGSPGSSA